MNRSRSLFGLGLLVVACAVSFAAARDPLTLKYTPKVGDDFKYKMSGDFSMASMSANISADLDSKVTKVDKDGSYTVESATKNMQIAVNDQTIPQPDTMITGVRAANGDIVDVQTSEEAPNLWRLAELNTFIYPDKPVNVGDTWSAPLKADEKKGIVAATRDFKVDSLEKVGTHDTAKIKVTFKETEGDDALSKDGYVWIDTTDGSLVKSQFSLSNYPTPGGAVNGNVSMERVE